MNTELSPTVQDILDSKRQQGVDAYLWLHDSGDCILWSDEQSSVDDDGARAVARWTLTDEESDELLGTGHVDEQV